MPKTPTTPSKPKAKASALNPDSPSKIGWSTGDKSLLFDHVVNFGQNDWDKAVPGKTAQQAREQWKKTLLPQIRKQCGFLG
ncbi:hypothetical protein V865_005680 [Kwoniella europaea PYCC6329]|uniref:Myb-like domain-containing protein n=1 Tax=Kwoniella europaea PYCC6329 TaxID=1423913 RepID=A0AAX4KN44_9TREE